MIFLSILVVLHHVSVGYGTMGGWCYVTPEKLTGMVQIVFSALFGIEATFSMGLFFFISAYLTIPSLEKKGAGKFLKARLIRLLIPLLFVMFILAPSVLYFIELHNQTTTLPWFDYVLQLNIASPNTSHAWFILVLIAFELLYVFYWKYIRPLFSISEHLPDGIPTHGNIFTVIFLCGLLTVISRQYYPIGTNYLCLQFANFVPYVFMYSLGILVFRKHWLDSLSKKVAKTWFTVSLFSAVYFCSIIYFVIKNPPLINNYISGFNKESVSVAFAETFLCFGFSGFLLYIFRTNFDRSCYILLKMRENRYGVYIFHSVVVVGVTIALESLSLSIYVRYFLACILCIVLSYIFVGLIRKMPFVKRAI